MIQKFKLKNVLIKYYFPKLSNIPKLRLLNKNVCNMQMFQINIRKLFIFVFFYMINYSTSEAQVLSADPCGTGEIFSADVSGDQPWKGNNAFLENYLNDIGYDENVNQVFYRIPVKFWVYRLSDGSKGVSPRFLRDQIRQLNYYHSVNNTGIRFYQHPKISYIDNDRLYILRYMTSGFFQALTTKDEGSINVLVSGNLIRKNSGNRPKEYHGVHNSISGNIIVRQKIATQTLTHEIGHFFGLRHPHEHWKRGKRKQEAVDRTRKHPGLFKSGLVCEYNGDKLCDTPAEPNMAKYTNSDCHYTGWNVTDNWGDVYKPHTDNIMSYATERECRTNFTRGQIAVMLYTAENKKYADYWKTKANDQFNFDYHEPNNSREAASEISLNAKHHNSFHKIFAGKKAIKLTDETDWFYFEIKSEKAQDMKLIIEKGKFKFPENMSVSVYEQDSFLFSETIEASQRRTLPLENINKGKYFIKISNNRPANHLTGYTLSVMQQQNSENGND
jgi:hypothetical protein